MNPPATSPSKPLARGTSECERARRSAGPGCSSSRSRWAVAAGGAVVLAVVLPLVVGRLLGGREATLTDLDLDHGLDVDPADETLYLGSHDGLNRVGADGVEEPEADRVQDFMGFTVAGHGHFLASGHPAEGSTGATSLGLLESTDAGQSWRTLGHQVRAGSLSEVGSVDGPVQALAVADADGIYIPTSSRLPASNDGGSSFEPYLSD